MLGAHAHAARRTARSSTASTCSSPAPHFDIDSDKDAVKRIADHIAGYGLEVGSFVAPIWGGAGRRLGMGSGGGPPELPDAGAQRPAPIGRQMRETGLRRAAASASIHRRV
jgi:hypothetical protein